MKKKIFLVAALLSIVAGIVFAGLAYAAPPSAPVSTSKLVGIGLVGYGVIDGQDTRWETRVVITNPNTVDTLNIDMVRIYDRDGVKKYEGPFLRMFLIGSQLTPPYPEITTLQPHQMEIMRLSLWTGGVDDPTEVYTVEIFWSGGKNVLPLIGTVSQWVVTTQSSTNKTTAIGEVNMENMPAK
jgi:hypothetical protein